MYAQTNVDIVPHLKVCSDVEYGSTTLCFGGWSESPWYYMYQMTVIQTYIYHNHERCHQTSQRLVLDICICNFQLWVKVVVDIAKSRSQWTISMPLTMHVPMPILSIVITQSRDSHIHVHNAYSFFTGICTCIPWVEWDN